ncbi:hypothetical protein HDU91_004274 [Kappamyces sp. JEL0680]|nr:hypothetical protein HDU91_004274 [Kappamyces sp. JEL0680]
MVATVISPSGFQYRQEFQDWFPAIIPQILSLLEINQPIPFHALLLIFNDSNQEGVSKTVSLEGLELHTSAKRLAHHDTSIAADAVSETKGQIVFVLVEFLLNWLIGGAPGAVVTGIADFARISFHLVPPHWDRKQKEKWDAGYSETAYFLHYIQETSCPGFVARLVNELAVYRFSQDVFCKITGQPLLDLWYAYCAHKVEKMVWKGTEIGVVDQSQSPLFASLFPNSCTAFQSVLHESLLQLYPDEEFPTLKQLYLFVRDFDGVAYTGNGPEPYSKEIHLSSRYLASYAKSHTLSECSHECLGVIHHEMIHVHQANAFSTCPGGLIEGVADYCRLQAGLAPPHWGPPTRKDNWRNGYQTCGLFLNWIEKEQGVVGLVVQLNQSMHKATWSDALFSKLVGGLTIDELWDIYLDNIQS